MKEIEFIIINDLNGIFHVSGEEKVSKYGFGEKICENLGISSDFISPSSIEDFNFTAKRSSDQTLDCSLYTKISGRKLPSINDTINSITAFYNGGLYEKF